MELHEIRYFLALSKTLNFTRAAEIMQCQPARTDPGDPEDGGRTRRSAVLARAEQHASDRARPPAGAAPDRGAGPHPGGEGDRDAVPAAGQRAASSRRDVHDRAGAVRQLPQPFRADNPGVEITLVEAVPDRLCELLLKGELDVALLAKPEGFASPLQPQPLYQRALRHRLLGRPRVRAQERRAHRRSGRRAVPGAHQLRIFRRTARCLPRQRITPRRLIPQRARGLDPDHGRRRHGHLLPAGILQHDSRRDQPSGGGSGGRARGVAGDCRRAPLVVAAVGFRARGAPVSLARRAAVRRCRWRRRHSVPDLPAPRARG